MSAPVLRQILLVEDDPDIQTVAKFALEAVGGFRVAICSSGLEALATAPQLAPDLILLDMMMPDLDGVGTLRALRALPDCSATPVIFMTAKVQPHEVVEYRALGALGVIAKPFDPMTLSASIAGLWEQRDVK
jgi:CheY-like chemotaxis protein